MEYMKLRVLLILAFFILLASLTAVVYDSTNGALTRLTIDRVTLSSSKIPASFDQMTMVYFSDLHAHTLSDDYYQKVVDKINACNPDFVVFGGDLIDDSSYADYSNAQRASLIALLNSIKAPYGKFAVLSETDLAHTTELTALYMEAGFEVLNQKRIPIHVLGSPSISLIGWDETSSPSLLTEIQTSDYTLAFAHDPSFADTLNGKGIDAMFSGKTHGGQVTLPLMGPMVYKDELYRRGHIALSKMDLYVSTGIGVSTLKARWMTDPSFYLITFDAP